MHLHHLHQLDCGGAGGVRRRMHPTQHRDPDRGLDAGPGQSDGPAELVPARSLHRQDAVLAARGQRRTPAPGEPETGEEAGAGRLARTGLAAGARARRNPGSPGRIRDLAGDGNHYAATVIAEEFRGMNRVQQQRLVNQALKSLLDGSNAPLHALALQTSAPD